MQEAKEKHTKVFGMRLELIFPKTVMKPDDNNTLFIKVKGTKTLDIVPQGELMNKDLNLALNQV